MNTKQMAELYYERQQLAQELGEEGQDTGDEIYCQIGELLTQIAEQADVEQELLEKLDLLILEMSDADRREYFIKGFETAAEK